MQAFKLSVFLPGEGWASPGLLTQDKLRTNTSPTINPDTWREIGHGTGRDAQHYAFSAIKDWKSLEVDPYKNDL